MTIGIKIAKILMISPPPPPPQQHWSSKSSPLCTTLMDDDRCFYHDDGHETSKLSRNNDRMKKDECIHIYDNLYKPLLSVLMPRQLRTIHEVRTLGVAIIIFRDDVCSTLAHGSHD